MAMKYLGSTALAKLCEIMKSAVATLEAAIPTKTSDITNDSGFITSSALSGYATTTALANKLDKSTITVKEASGTVSVAKSTYKSITSVSLAAGTWIIKGTLNFASNTSGYRAGYIGTSTSSWQGADGFQIAPTSGGGTFAQTTAIVVPAATTTYYLVAYHTSTSSLSTTGWIKAVRLK